MAVLLGHAVGDENGKARGGNPGDQNGREVLTQNWYLNGKGWRVLRAKDSAKAKMIAENMLKACNNANIGYDQGDRNTLYDVAPKVGFDCAKVTTPCETDCSALVRVCCMYAGIKVGNFNTANEVSILMKTGAFTELVGDEYTKDSARLKAGDILTTRVKGHTAVILTDGPLANKSEQSTPIMPSQPATKTGKVVQVIGGSVRVRAADNIKGKYLFTAKKGKEFEFIDIAPSGWYHIRTDIGEAYISNRKDLTRVQDI